MTDSILKKIHSGLLAVTCCSQFISPRLANTFSKVSSNIKGCSVDDGSLRLIFLSDCQLKPVKFMQCLMKQCQWFITIHIVSVEK